MSSTQPPSNSFHAAASYLSNTHSLPSIPNATKLELYGLYKYITTSRAPDSSRPSIFDISGRAKWDAWKASAAQWSGKEQEAEEKYKQIAMKLGWQPGVASEPEIAVESELTVEELLLQDDSEASGSADGGGSMGNFVSAMQRPTVDEQSDESSPLHRCVISGDLPALKSLLSAHPDTDVNEFDPYGFAPIHLACDRGYVDIVKLLIEQGADRSIKDADGLTPLDLAREAQHQDIIALLDV